MEVKDRHFILKNNKVGVIRSATVSDVEKIINVVDKTAKETIFLSRAENEQIPTVDEELEWIINKNKSMTNLFLICEVENEIVGTFSLNIYKKQKLKHRAMVGISILEKYWGLGIGTEFFEEGLRVAKNNDVEIVELDFIEGNVKARGLYEKMGFKITGRRPNAIKMNDEYLDEYMMQKVL